MRFVLLAAATLFVAAPLFATISTQPACCFCRTGGPQVAFCTEIDSAAEEAQAIGRCDLESGSLVCLAMMRGPANPATCGAQLAEIAVVCPVANGAPTAGGPVLAILLLALPALGFAALRTRARKARC